MRAVRDGLGVLVALIGVAGCSALRASGPATTPAADAPVAQVRPVEITAVVDAVDQNRRQITLRRAKGGPLVLAVDASVENLRSVRRGSRMTVRYTPAAVVRVRKSEAAARGPAASVPHATTVTTKVSVADRAQHTVTFTGADGKPVTLGVESAADFEQLATGTLAEITYTEAVALAISKPAKRR